MPPGDELPQPSMTLCESLMLHAANEQRDLPSTQDDDESDAENGDDAMNDDGSENEESKQAWASLEPEVAAVVDEKKPDVKAAADEKKPDVKAAAHENLDSMDVDDSKDEAAVEICADTKVNTNQVTPKKPEQDVVGAAARAQSRVMHPKCSICKWSSKDGCSIHRIRM